jgi:hypothetical protein
MCAEFIFIWVFTGYLYQTQVQRSFYLDITSGGDPNSVLAYPDLDPAKNFKADPYYIGSGCRMDHPDIYY